MNGRLSVCRGPLAGAHVIVIGAGATGLSLAWRLCSRGARVTTLEAEPRVGGLAATIRQDGYCLDIGPHSFFSDDAAVRDWTLGLFDRPLEPRPRRVKFLYGRRYLDYPLTARGVLTGMGAAAGLCAALSFLWSRLAASADLRRRATADHDETVEEWAIASFGPQLYRSFFKPYTEQFWKIPCAELSSRSIPTSTRMSFANTCRMLLRRSQTRSGESLIERESLPTYYPPTGFGEICERIAAEVTAMGGQILLERRATAIERLDTGRMRVIYEGGGSGEQLDGDIVVSTMPLGALIAALRPVAPDGVIAAAGRLDYRALTVLGIVTDKQDILGCGYTYVLNRPYNRVSELNEFTRATSPDGGNILAVEIPCVEDGFAWRATAEELLDSCIGALAEDGFLQLGDVKRLLQAKALHAYPVYRKDYARPLETVMEHLRGVRGLVSAGRCGEFRYMDVDECVKRAFQLAERLEREYGRQS